MAGWSTISRNKKKAGVVDWDDRFSFGCLNADSFSGRRYWEQKMELMN